MKLTIDTTSKTIKVEQPIKLADFVKEIKKILPDWKEYELSYIEAQTYIPYWPVYPSYPIDPIYTDGTGIITTGDTLIITNREVSYSLT